MLKKLLLITTLFLSFSSIASNTTAPTFSSPHNKIIVTPNNPEFTITLQSNKTTGFSWNWAPTQYDKNIIALVSHQYIAPQNKKLMGAPGYETWTFKAIYPATPFRVNQVGHVRMMYARPWTKDGAAQTNFIVVLRNNSHNFSDPNHDLPRRFSFARFSGKIFKKCAGVLDQYIEQFFKNFPRKARKNEPVGKC